MDDSTFDNLTRSFAVPSRRAVFAALGAALFPALFAQDGDEDALAEPKHGRRRRQDAVVAQASGKGKKGGKKKGKGKKGKGKTGGNKKRNVKCQGANCQKKRTCLGNRESCLLNPGKCCSGLVCCGHSGEFVCIPASEECCAKHGVNCDPDDDHCCKGLCCTQEGICQPELRCQCPVRCAAEWADSGGGCCFYGGGVGEECQPGSNDAQCGHNGAICVTCNKPQLCGKVNGLYQCCQREGACTSPVQCCDGYQCRDGFCTRDCREIGCPNPAPYTMKCCEATGECHYDKCEDPLCPGTNMVNCRRTCNLRGQPLGSGHNPPHLQLCPEGTTACCTDEDGCIYCAGGPHNTNQTCPSFAPAQPPVVCPD
jgi:hypothetical protein